MAAPTLISRVKATPYSVVYQIVGSGNEGTRTGTTLYSDLVEGPLKRAVAQHLANNNCDLFNLDQSASGQIRAYYVDAVNVAEPTPVVSTIRWIANGISATLDDNAIVYVEFRFRHSRDR